MSDNHDLLNDNDMYSFSGYEVDDMCSNNDIDACGNRRASLEKSLILRGFSGFLLEYEPVLLAKNNVN